MYIDDTPGLTLMTLRAKARRLAVQHDIQAIVIDYLQLMSAPSNAGRNRQEEVAEISRGVKALARELSVPVICLSQLNRATEGREGHRPRLSDLRESGSIEQDADVVMMLHREDYYHRGEEDWEDNNIAEVIVVKQRNGPTGTVKLQFHGASTRFHNLETRIVAPGGMGGGESSF
jgi:replicative DNA helicase